MSSGNDLSSYFFIFSTACFCLLIYPSYLIFISSSLWASQVNFWISGIHGLNSIRENLLLLTNKSTELIFWIVFHWLMSNWEKFLLNSDRENFSFSNFLKIFLVILAFAEIFFVDLGNRPNF